MRHHVCGRDDLERGEKRALELDGRRVVLVRAADGSYHALADLCPHQGAPLSGGFLGGVLSREPADVIRCPWHNYAFDVRTGRSLLEPERYRVRVYDVSVEDGAVVVELGG